MQPIPRRADGEDSGDKFKGLLFEKNECFMHVDDATGDEAKWIKAYNILQYNSMFDEKDRSSLLFPYLK